LILQAGTARRDYLKSGGSHDHARIGKPLMVCEVECFPTELNRAALANDEVADHGKIEVSDALPAKHGIVAGSSLKLNAEGAVKQAVLNHLPLLKRSTGEPGRLSWHPSIMFGRMVTGAESRAENGLGTWVSRAGPIELYRFGN